MTAVTADVSGVCVAVMACCERSLYVMTGRTCRIDAVTGRTVIVGGVYV